MNRHNAATIMLKSVNSHYSDFSDKSELIQDSHRLSLQSNPSDPFALDMDGDRYTLSAYPPPYATIVYLSYVYIG